MTEVLPAQEDQGPEGSHKQTSVTEALFDGLEALRMGLLDDNFLPNWHLFLLAVDKEEVSNQDEYEDEVIVAIDAVEGDEQAKRCNDRRYHDQFVEPLIVGIVKGHVEG